MNIQVFGDSHCRLFSLSPKLISHYPEYKNINLQCHSFSAASAAGLLKKESKLNIRNKVESIIDRKCDAHVFAFGQVDVELGIYYRIFVKKEIVGPTFFEDIVAGYIEWVKSLGLSRPIIKGVNLSVIKYQRFAEVYINRMISKDVDDQTKKDNLQRLSSKLPSYVERNRDLIRFNKLLSESCSKNGIKYFDINNKITDVMGSVSEVYIPAGFDHHLIDSIYMRKIHIDSLVYTF